MSFKKLRPLCLVFSLMIAQSALGQKKQLPGYLVNLQGDTIRGSIESGKWRKNPDQINFRSKSNAPGTYKSTDIQGFSVNGEIYISATIDVERTSTIESELDYDQALRLQSGLNTFLRTIIKGPKSLYHYKDKFGKNQIYIKTDSGFELLKYKKYLKQLDRKTVIRENALFRDQLRNYLSDCPAVHSNLVDTNYDLQSLKKIFIAYYSCHDKAIGFQEALKKAPVNIGLLAGVSSTNLTFSGEEYIYLTNGNFDASMNLAAGVFIDIVFARSNEQWSLYNELLYNSFQVNGEYNDVRSAELYDNYYSTLGYKQLSLNSMLRYKFPVAGFHMYLNAGISNGFALSKTDHLRVESRVFGNESVVETTVGRGDQLRNYEVGLSAGFGVKVQQFIMDIRYIGGNGITDFASSNTSKIYLLLGYEF